MSWLKNHLKRYGSTHLLLILFVAFQMWTATMDYNFSIKTKEVGQQVASGVVFIHVLAISFFFAVWAGSVIYLYIGHKEEASGRKERYRTGLSVIASVFVFLLSLAIILNGIIYLKPLL